MKRLSLGVALAAAMAGPALADWIYVDFEGQREEFTFEDFDEVNVCQFKAIVGKRFGLPVSKFMLAPLRHFEYTEKTMEGAGLGRSHVLEMWRTGSSYQCH